MKNHEENSKEAADKRKKALAVYDWESEDEGSPVLRGSEPSKKKGRGMDKPPLFLSRSSRLNPVMRQTSWLPTSLVPTRRNAQDASKMSEQDGDEDVISVEEYVRGESCRTPSTQRLSASLDDDEIAVLEMRESRGPSKLVTRRPALSHSLTSKPPPAAPSINPDFHFTPSTSHPSGQAEGEAAIKYKTKDSNLFRSFNSHRQPFRKKAESISRSYLGSFQDRIQKKHLPASKRRESAVYKSFRREDKLRYQQLLQQFTETSLVHSNSMSKIFSPHTSSDPSPVPPMAPLGMVMRAKQTPLWTQQKQQEMENSSFSSSLSSRLVEAASLPKSEDTQDRSDLETPDIPIRRFYSQRNGKSISSQFNRSAPVIPLIDLSRTESDSNSRSAKESDTDSVVIVEEVCKTAPTNALEQKLLDHDVYDVEWVQTMRKKYDNLSQDATREANTTTKIIRGLEERRNQLTSLDDKVTRRLKHLDLTFTAKYPEVQLSDEEEEEEFPPLTSEMEDEIDDALTGSPASQVLIEKFHIQITRRDIATLDGLNWLNDEVINFYMNLMMERSNANDNYPCVYAFNTFFYPKLFKSGYQSVRRWTKKVDIFNHDMLIVPIHLGMHWCLAMVDFKMRSIRYYDSMLGSNHRCLRCLLEYLEAEHEDKKKLPYSTSDWKLEHMKKIPQQMNGSDCGVFTCKFAEYLSRRGKINFSQEHMPYFRRKMVYEIIKGKIF